MLEEGNLCRGEERRVLIAISCPGSSTFKGARPIEGWV